MDSKIYVDAPNGEEFCKFLTADFTESFYHMEECNLFTFIFKSVMVDNMSYSSADWLSEQIAQVTYLACVMPKSTFIICEQNDDIITEKVKEIWKATGTNLFISDNVTDVYEDVAKKVSGYARFINGVLGDA